MPHPRDDLPIGVFDSGVGGLTVVSALRRTLPGESILYLGDTARLPYGTKSPTTVARYTQRNVDFLVARGVKAVVVACNSASALALSELHSPVPTWGVLLPGAARAADVSAGRVGVIGTESTIRSEAYPRALRELREDLEVYSRACPLFVPLVEEGWSDDPITLEVARRYLTPLLEHGIDTLVLGCTHYPLLIPILRDIVGPDVKLVDSAKAVSETVAAEFRQAQLATSAGNPEHHICVTDPSPRFGRIAAEILGVETELEWLDTV